MTPAPTLQCSTGPFWAFELERALDAVAEAGFTQVELMVTRDPQTQRPETPLRLAEERGLQISSVHGPFLLVTKSVWGLDPLEKIRRGAEMCAALGASTLIVHPPFLWEQTYARWIASSAAEFSAETGVAVAVETMYPKWVAGRRLRGYRWLEPKALTLAAHHLVLDTSHVTVARHDIFDAYRIMQPKLLHIHLSNNAGDGRDGHLELEQGILPMSRFLGELRRTKYSGSLSLELSTRRYAERHEALVQMLRRNREYVEEHLAREVRMVKGLPRR